LFNGLGLKAAFVCGGKNQLINLGFGTVDSGLTEVQIARPIVVIAET
jgi:hypothetical protein